MPPILALQPTASLINSSGVHASPIHGLQSCSSMSQLKQFHSQIIRLGLSIDNDAMGRLIKFCAVSKNGDLDYALLLFKTIPYPDAFIYNTLIRGYLQQQSSRACILLYLQMLHKFVLPNKFTFPSLIRACCIDNAIEEGKQVHAHVLKFGFKTDRFSQNNLIHMYANFQSLEDARRVFDGIELPDAVAWTTLLTGYAQCGFVDEAFQVFESMPEHSSASWNAMISSFVQNNRFHEAFALFNRMRSENIVLDKYVAASMLSACTGLGALEQGKWIHRYIKKSGIELDSKLATTLIDMYCKCGCLDCAFLVFTHLPEKGISSWNCMIGGMAMHGRGEAAIELFKEMETKMVTPDNITFLNVLSACAHSGLVEEGRHYFRHFIELYGIEPRTEHFGCMVDLYGRAGMLDEAVKLISEMPMNPDAGVLGALVGACKIHGDVDLGEEIGLRVIELEPTNSGRYVLLGNLYAEAGRWEGVAEVRKLMNDREVKKAPGFSMIELEGVVYEFIAGGRAHSEVDEIYVKVHEMLECIRSAGYVPENEIDVDKGNPIYYHSEKLAVAFGLLKTKAGETLRITKNLRICKDCHQALKLVSKVFERKIIVRDRNRFHHFSSGECSCNDYWYTNTHANKGIDLFGEGGIDEPTTDDNIEMTSSLSSQELINVGKKTMDDTDPAIECSKMVVEQTVEVGRQSTSILEGQATAMKKIIAICQSGGEFVKNKDGSLSYNGGEAYAIDIDQQTNLYDFKTEVAEMFSCSIDTMSIKYFLPGNKRTLISISKDKDLKRMVKFLRDSITVDVFILSEEAAARNLSNMPASRSSRTTVSEAVVPVVEPIDVAVETIIAIDQIGMDVSSEVPLICVPAGSSDEKHRKAAQQWENAIIGVDQRFNSFSEFREALHKYSVAHGFAYRYKKNDSHRVTVKCKYQGCPWRIYASRLSTTQLICIKKMNTSHSCEGAAAKAGYRATRGWVGNIIKEKLKVSPNYKPKDIADDIKREYGIQLNYSQAWRAKEIAREQLQGSYKEAYNQLPYFCDKIKETNPGSVASFTTKDDSSFHRLFVSFHASISGFQQGCRPLLFLDSTPLNSKYQGVFLTATAADGEDGIFPAAFAVVDNETQENWHWFLLELKSAVQTSEQITFVADFRNGLNKSLAEIFDKSYHSYCLRHLAEKLNNDLKGQFSHEARRFMINDFYAAALASKLEDFQRCAESIKGISPDAYNWIIQSEPEHWANAFFGGARYNHITSNFGQQFYCSVSEAHELPITQMIDVLRGKMMETIYRRRVESDQWMTKLTPSNEEKLQKEISIARSFQVLLSHGSTFEVRGESVDIVDVDHWDCSCKGWQLTGLPCCHAIAVFQCIGRSPYDYCSRYFTVENYRLTYADSIHPVPNVDRPILGESTQDLVTVTPPPTRRPPGRPKMKQNESLEVVKRQLQCSKCKGLGHNKKTCKDS